MRTKHTRRVTDPEEASAKVGALRWRFSEHGLKAAVAATLWFATTVGVFVSSYIEPIAPENAGFWRFWLLVFVLGMTTLTIVLSRTISHRSFQLFIELSMIPALALNVVLLQLTPATEAVLFNLIFTLVFAGFYLRRTALQVTMLGFIVIALSTLFTTPAKDTPYLSSFLVVYIATIVVTVSMMHVQNAERIDALSRLLRRGLTDPLTGVANLRQLRKSTDQMTRRLDLKRNAGEVLGLILIDIENFKSANTRYGHLGGDHALRKIAEQMQRVAAGGAVVARVGGDEFAVLLQEDSRARLAERAEIFRGAVRAAGSTMEMPGVEIDAAVGIAFFPEDGRDLAELMGVADRRLYEKKGTKRHLVPNLDRTQLAAEGPPPWLTSEIEESMVEPNRAESLFDLAAGGNIAALASRTLFSRAAALGWLVGCGILTISLLMPGAYPDPSLTWWMVLIVGVVPLPVILGLNASPGGIDHFLTDVSAYIAITVALAGTGGINSPVAPLLVLHGANQAWFWGRRMLPFRIAMPLLVAASPLFYTSVSSAQADVVELTRIYVTCVLLVGLVLAAYFNRVILEQLHQTAEQLAGRDPLTGIANRRDFNQYLQDQIVDPTADKFAIVMIDLDNFKRVNTEHGHQAGDQVLTEIAKSLAAVARAEDCIARVGGDEFAAVLPGVGEGEARELAERLVGAVTATDAATKFDIGASAGYALWPQHGESLDQLVFTADSALMTVKATGKGNARVAKVVSAVG